MKRSRFFRLVEFLHSLKFIRCKFIDGLGTHSAWELIQLAVVRSNVFGQCGVVVCRSLRLLLAVASLVSYCSKRILRQTRRGIRSRIPYGRSRVNCLSRSVCRGGFAEKILHWSTIAPFGNGGGVLQEFSRSTLPASNRLARHHSLFGRSKYQQH